MNVRGLSFLPVVLGAVLIAHLHSAPSPVPQGHRVDDAALRAAAGDEWLTYGLTQSEARFSPLKDINAANVKRLSAAWSYEVGSGGGGQ